MNRLYQCHVCSCPSTAVASQAGSTLYSCKSCKHSFVSPFPSNHELTQYYSGFSWRRPSEQLTSGDIAQLKVRGKTILHYLLPPTCDYRTYTIFDYGCGVGLECLAFSLNGANVYGSDCDQEALSIARTISPSTRFFHQDNIPANILGQFDLVWSSHVIEHLASPYNLLKAAHSLLKPGGVICLLTPNAQSLEFFFRLDLISNYFLKPTLTYSLWSLANITRRSWVYLDPPRHLNIFSVDSLRILCEKDFKVVSIHSEYSPEALFNLKSSFNYSMVRLASILKIAKNIPLYTIYSLLRRIDQRRIHGDSLVAILKKQ